MFTFDLAYFHGWGTESTEFEGGMVADTVAIIELPKGHILTTAPGKIRFIDAVEGVE